MITVPHMGLKVWNLTTDSYDSGQLADNWAKVDEHDHSSGKGVQIGTDGIEDGSITRPKLAEGALLSPGTITTIELQDGGVTTPKLANLAVTTPKLADSVVTNPKLAPDAVTSSKILDGTVADTDLASPNNALRKLVHQESGGVWYSTGGGGGSGPWVLSDGRDFPLGTTSTSGWNAFLWDPTKHTVSGKTTKLILRLSVFPNGTDPGVSFNASLRQVTAVGGVGVSTSIVTLAAAPTGATTPNITPAGGSAGAVETAQFAAPATGLYILAYAAGGPPAAGINVTSQLYVVHV